MMKFFSSPKDHSIINIICAIGKPGFNPEMLFEAAKLFLNGIVMPQKTFFGQILVLLASEFGSEGAFHYLRGNDAYLQDASARALTTITKIHSGNFDCGKFLSIHGFADLTALAGLDIIELLS